MNRAIISQRITSILAEIERLNNALYAMNTTDIQRYPDNYEVLSTDAALRAERITCRLRHLIYATTSIKKEEYLRSAETMQGIEISENDGILEIKLPCLLPKRRQRVIDSAKQELAHQQIGAFLHRMERMGYDREQTAQLVRSWKEEA